MKKLTIRTQCKTNTTTIENEFIDTYMSKANGEYVKVYLYLLRHLHDTDNELTLSCIADFLDNTERDILRALKYWQGEGLLAITYDEHNTIIGIDLATISIYNAGVAANTAIPVVHTQALPHTSATVSSTNLKPAAISHPVKPRKEFKQLLFMTEQYIGKTLSKSDVDMISYFYDTLHFPLNLIEFLIEYCVENGHKSMHYIQSVALAWSDRNILTVDAAKESISSFNKEYYSVLKAFGITGRNPVSTEKQYVDKWMHEYGFSIELICEACTRTIAKIHQPSFEYADSILNSWKAKNVHYINDLNKLDKDYADSKKPAKKTSEKATSKNSFNNFEQRTYDLSSLEMQLLNSK